MGKKRKKRIKGSKAALQKAICPVNSFVYSIDEDTEIELLARRVTPGHLMILKETSLLRIYNTQQTNAAVQPAPEKAVESKKLDIKMLSKIIEDVNVVASVCSLSIVSEKGIPYLSEDDCKELLEVTWMREITEYALQGAVPEEDPDDVGRFPEEADGPDESESAGDNE